MSEYIESSRVITETEVREQDLQTEPIPEWECFLPADRPYDTLSEDSRGELARKYAEISRVASGNLRLGHPLASERLALNAGLRDSLFALAVKRYFDINQ